MFRIILTQNLFSNFIYVKKIALKIWSETDFPKTPLKQIPPVNPRLESEIF